MAHMQTHITPLTVAELVEQIGRKPFEKQVRVKTQLVTRAIAENTMPTRWYVAVRASCKAVGIATPEHLFKWHIHHVTKQNDNCGSELQGPETTQNGDAA